MDRLLYFYTMRIFASISLTGIYLLLAIGVSINSHYCGGVEVSRALMMEAPSCGHHQHADMCEDHSAENKQDKGCCSSDSEFFQIQNDLIAVTATALVPNVAVLSVDEIYSPQVEVLQSTSFERAYPINKPPPLTVSRQLASIQSFLL